MVNTRIISAPFVVISLMGILSSGCSFTLTSAPTPTRIPESKLPTATTTPNEGTIGTEATADVILPPEGLDNLEPFAAENAAGLFEVNSLNVGAPVVGVFFAQEVRGYSLWVAVWNDTNRSSRLEHWDLYTGRVIGELARGELLAPKSLSGTADGRWLVTADESNVELWDVFSGPLVFDFEPSPWLTEVAVAPAGNSILAVGYASVDGTVLLIDMISNQTVSVFRHGDYVSDIDFTSDGRYLASGAADGSLKIVDIQKLEETSPFRETGWVDSLALELSPPEAGTMGPLLATSVSGAITLWDVAAGALLRPFAGQAGIVESMDFSPNGEILASGDRSGAVVLWNTITGEAISALWPDLGGIAQLTFSSDGTLLAAVTQDGYVLIWAAGP